MAHSTEESATEPVSLRDLVADVTMTLAPEEAPILAALKTFDDDSEVSRRLTATRRADQRLGFGLDQAGALVCAVVWIGVNEAVRRITDAVTDKAKQARPRWWPFRRHREQARTVEVPPLGDAQLKIVERSVLEAARAAGLSQQRSTSVADGVIKRLTLKPDRHAAVEP